VFWRWSWKRQRHKRSRREITAENLHNELSVSIFCCIQVGTLKVKAMQNTDSRKPVDRLCKTCPLWRRALKQLFSFSGDVTVRLMLMILFHKRLDLFAGILIKKRRRFSVKVPGKSTSTKSRKIANAVYFEQKNRTLDGKVESRIMFCAKETAISQRKQNVEGILHGANSCYALGLGERSKTTVISPGTVEAEHSTCVTGPAIANLLWAAANPFKFLRPPSQRAWAK